MNDPRVHARFLAYRERHAYFGRGDLRQPLSYAEYVDLDAERARLSALPARTAEEQARLAELRRQMLED
jgi:hypothetical protein